MIYTELMICRRLLSLEVLEPRTEPSVPLLQRIALFDGHRLRQVSRLIDVHPHYDGCVIG